MSFIPVSWPLSRLRERLSLEDIAAQAEEAASVAAAVADAQALDDLYAAYEDDAFERLDAVLVAKAALLDDLQPVGAPHVVVYGATHPHTGGGSDATAWTVRRKAEGLIPGAVSYSHTVSWDANTDILAAEEQELAFWRLRHDAQRGSAVQLAALQTQVSYLDDWTILLTLRNDLFGV